MTLILEPIPSKMDIIPIHTSDRAAFKRCRRRWDWSSPMRNNLVPDVSQHGVVMNLWFGTGVHYALKEFYSPEPKNPVLSFERWYDLVWNGGLCTEDFLEFSYDRNPELKVGGLENPKDNSVPPDLYLIKGLRTLHYDPDEDEFERHRQLGIGMMEYYKDYAAKNDQFKVIAAEHTFSVPVLDPTDGSPLYFPDWRDEGKLKPVHLRGTQDAIIQDEIERYGVLEHKSAIDITDSYFEKLEMDDQCTSYMSAFELETGEKCSFVLYNALRKAYPTPPTILKNGMPSINRKEESTTLDMFQDYLRTSGLEIVARGNPKYQAYMDWLQEIKDDQFVVRRKVRRTPQEIKNHRIDVFHEVMDMIDFPKIYRNATNDFSCTRCVFRGPCIAKNDGSDYESMLEDGFIKNWGR